MTAQELKQKFLDFFIQRKHKLLPNVSLIPEHDPTALFISAGMHPLVPYLLGEPHPLGKRLVSVQRCLRTGDIEKVGDTFHHTFFEMLGNWSLGDPASPDGIGQGGYWKREAISWSFEFLTDQLKLDSQRVHISYFGGDKDAPRDNESAEIWREVGIPKERIYSYGKKENWWGPVGETGPCGPDTEMFFDVTEKPCSSSCHPNDNCGRFFEIWNNVFMEYNKTTEGKYEPLKQKNVDTGMGVERVIAVLNGFYDDYRTTDLFWPIIEQLEQRLGVKYNSNNEITKSLRIIADHLKASVFLISDGVKPSNKLQGYILRRLLRRSVSKTFSIKKGFDSKDFKSLVQAIINIYPDYFKETNFEEIVTEVSDEIRKFRWTIERGFKEIEKYPTITGKIAFDLYQTYGFPYELTKEEADKRGVEIPTREEFDLELVKHQELSRTASAGMFKGGLAEQSEIATKYHTATHLLQASLRQVLGSHVSQKGSNINAERLRFDFSHSEKMTVEQIKEVEDLVNKQIGNNLEVHMEVMDFKTAIETGALTVPGEKYPEQVKVYSIGDFSKEACGGPHVDFTARLGKFKIIKEESVSSGIRRIYAILE